MSTGFSLFVILGTLGTLVVITALLLLNRKVTNPGQTTGHEFDGIEEYDNPLPAWWFWGFLLSIAFALGYLIYYPGLGNFKGLSGWTSAGQLAQQQAEAEERYGPVFAQYREIPVHELATIPAAMRMGQRLFANNCAQCHGSAGTGAPGFPNLTDNEWQWGNSAEQIAQTLNNGRQAVMPAWSGVVNAIGIRNLTEYVMQLSGREAVSDQAQAGQQEYNRLCAACHGADGSGQPMLGAPDLTNNIWLYGGSREQITDVLRHGRNGQMPGFAGRLDENRLHILNAYVQSLSTQ
ncbi:MAG: cytochrome-c oxidase, cbb3-type subunit III [Pseudohongiella sp.]|nr:cytochrome-c oxidase, cbb3-type subunit III [Pseudohongiella sp.]MDO9522052.1 cytochrome-c oxidase, cbb3-type subunit III [Pseudohongiella sp.]MDP2128687.1 cytochrome-c oxidase, cbb3-type subunit III [Pseudohongiella sp.]